MPTKPLKPCLRNGCRNLVKAGYCEQHKSKAPAASRQKSADGKRPSASERGYDHTWRKYRNWYLINNPLCMCEDCKEQATPLPANVVDHIKPHRGDKELFWDPDNHQAMNNICHSRKTALDDYGFVGNLWQPLFKRPACRVVVVTGPPGAGKTTYVKANAKKGDWLLDLDHIRAELTEKPLYHAQDDLSLEKALKQRNKILEGLHEKKDNQTVWFIITAGWRSQRRWWRSMLAAELVTIDTDLETCIERIQADERRPQQVKEKHIKAAATWWERYQAK